MAYWEERYLIVANSYETRWQVCGKLSEKFGKHGLVKDKPTVRSLATPFRMYDGMDEEAAPKKKPEPIDGPLLTERDKIKLERRKRKDERQREVRFDNNWSWMYVILVRNEIAGLSIWPDMVSTSGIAFPDQAQVEVKLGYV